MQHFLFLRRLRLAFLSLLVAMSPLLPVLRAGAQPYKLATADIPFDFLVGGGKLPAGRYMIVRLADHSLQLRSSDFKYVQHVFVNDAIAANIPDHGRMVFHQYGDRFFLADLWLSGTRAGLQCVKSRAEKEMLSTMAAPPAAASPGTEIALK